MRTLKIPLHIFLIATILLAISLISPTHAQFVNAVEKSIKAVAVVSGEERGVVINITVIVTPGDGRVFVSTTPYTEIDMQGSAQLSALTACDLIGEDFLKHDFFYIIEADAPIVGGPSAGAVMTIATISALKNLTLSDEVYMTGMIYPDGFIGPVGGIPYKLKAAAENGAKIFLIPKGQRFVTIHEMKKVQKGPFIVITPEVKRVDLIELGKELGVSVIEVETVNEALKYYTGYGIQREVGKFEISKYSTLLKSLADNMKSDTLKMYRIFVKMADKDVKEDIDKRLQTANESYKNGDYYTATSQYFTAKIFMRAEIYKKTLKDYSDIEREIGYIRNEIEVMKDEIKNYTPGIVSIQLIGAAEERLGKAEQYIEKVRTSESFNEAILNLAFARERVESAKSWLSLLPEIKEDFPVDEKEVKRRAELYLSVAESLIVYARSIGGIDTLLNGDRSAEESLTLARDLLSDEYYAGSIFASIDSIVKSALSIELIGVENLTSKIEASRFSAKSALSEAEAINPILAVAYYEYGETSENVYKLIYYKLSERLAKLLLNLAEEKENIKLVRVNYTLPTIKITPSIESVSERVVKSFSKVVEIPGLEITIAIIALCLGYLIRRV